MPKLQNPRRERFAQEFVKDLNGTKAAERVGCKHPGVKGSQLVAIPVVSARISELQAAVAERNEITVDGIAAQLDEDGALAYRGENREPGRRITESVTSNPRVRDP